MKSLFSGKKKLITIPLVFILGLTFLPFTIGILLALQTHKKISNKKLRYVSFMVIALFTLFFGSAWATAINSPEKTKPVTEQVQDVKGVVHNITQSTKPAKPTSTPSPLPSQTQTTPNKQNLVQAKVVAVIDGDTIDVDLGEGNIKRVRYIGINSPESVDPRKPIECFSKEAAAKNKELVGNKTVGLEKDVSETDRYGRLLRYVYVGDLFVNQILVSEGCASAASYPPDIKYQDNFRQVEQQARAGKKGLWGSCAGTSSPIPTKTTSTSYPTSIQTNTNTNTTTGKTCLYSCSGPDRDCKDFTSHTEVQAFFDCCGFTSTYDPMNLDGVGTGDGIACESM